MDERSRIMTGDRRGEPPSQGPRAVFLSCLRTKVPSLYVLRRIIVLSTLHSDVVGVKKLAEQTCRRRAPMRTVALLIFCWIAVNLPSRQRGPGAACGSGDRDHCRECIIPIPVRQPITAACGIGSSIRWPATTAICCGLLFTRTNVGTMPAEYELMLNMFAGVHARRRDCEIKRALGTTGMLAVRPVASLTTNALSLCC